MSGAGFLPEQTPKSPAKGVASALALLERLPKHPMGELRALFEGTRELVLTRAPGRLDVMGGIADYSGARVLEWPIAEAVVCAAGLSSDPSIRVVSLGADENERTAAFEIELSELFPPHGAADYARARALLRREARSAWAAYVVGAFVVLAAEEGVRFERGMRLLIVSEVPEGRGLSSSAALEVAALSAVAALSGLPLEGRRLARLAQIVENEVVGAPSGLMDQMTCACGEAGQFLSMVCQPAVLEAPVLLPAGLSVWGLDSGVRHSVGGSAYTAVRVAAFMGYRILAEAAGLRVQELEAGRVRVLDPEWKGYLANVSPQRWQALRGHVPEKLRGADFLARYHGITDSVTKVEPERVYLVRAATEHPILEHERVSQYTRVLRAGAPSTAELVGLGELMFQSHTSYAACGLDCEETALLVELLRAEGPGRGLFGAKITGGGSGGTVAVLGRTSARAVVEQVAAKYAQNTGRAARVIEGSSEGADSFGVLRLARARA